MPKGYVLRMMNMFFMHIVSSVTGIIYHFTSSNSFLNYREKIYTRGGKAGEKMWQLLKDYASSLTFAEHFY